MQVSWDDIADQETAKRLVQELVVWPMLNPHLFKASARSPRCMHSQAAAPRMLSCIKSGVLAVTAEPCCCRAAQLQGERYADT